jgi:hypothetical protein
MMRSRPLIGLAWLIVLPLAAAGGNVEEDTIKLRLDKAKKDYEEQIEDFRKDVREYFEKRENSARKDGDKKRVDQIKEERQQFTASGVLPKTVPATVVQKATNARKVLAAAYKQAVKEYTQAKKDDEANATEKELDTLLKAELAKSTPLGQKDVVPEIDPKKVDPKKEDLTKHLELRDDWPKLKGTLAKVVTVDTKKKTAQVQFADGKKADLNLEKGVEFIGSRGGKADIESPRFAAGRTIKIVYDSSGKTVKEIHLQILKAEDKKDGK